MLFVCASVTMFKMMLEWPEWAEWPEWQDDRMLRRRLTVWYIYIIISQGCGHGSHAVREAAGRVHNARQVQAGTNQVLDTKLFFSLTICSLCNNTIYFQEPTGVRNILEELWAQSVCLSEHGWNICLPKIKWVFSSFCHHTRFQRP